MKTIYLMCKWGLIGLLGVVIIYMLCVLGANWALADEATPVYDAELRMQNRSVNDYSGRMASQMVAEAELDELEAELDELEAELGGGISIVCSHTSHDVSVASILWELMQHPELVPAVEVALREYYKDKEASGHN